MTLSSALSAAQSSSLASTATVEEILKLERAMREAITRKDFAFLQAHIADEFVRSGLRGDQMRKQGYVQRVSAGKGLRVHVPGASSTLEKVRVRLFADTAIVTGIENYKSQTMESRINFTNVWVKLNGNWQRVAVHTSMPPPR